MKIDFYYDYLSPYAFMAKSRLKALKEPAKVHPVAIIAVMALVNNHPTPECPAKLAYALMDMARYAQSLNIPLEPNKAFLDAAFSGEVANDLLIRGAFAAQEMGVFDSYDDIIFNAVWGKPVDIASTQGRHDALAPASIDSKVLWELAESDPIKEKVSAANAAAAARGVFGAPTFFVDDEQFFGNDRFDFVERRVNGAA